VLLFGTTRAGALLRRREGRSSRFGLTRGQVGLRPCGQGQSRFRGWVLNGQKASYQRGQHMSFRRQGSRRTGGRQRQAGLGASSRAGHEGYTLGPKLRGHRGGSRDPGTCFSRRLGTDSRSVGEPGGGLGSSFRLEVGGSRRHAVARQRRAACDGARLREAARGVRTRSAVPGISSKLATWEEIEAPLATYYAATWRDAGSVQEGGRHGS